MASGPITSWQIDGETVETVSDFIFGGSQITTDGDCRYEIKRRFLLGRKLMTGGINWKNGIDIYTLLYIKYITNKDLLYNTESSVMADMEN